jgi:hypothetical protein
LYREVVSRYSPQKTLELRLLVNLSNNIANPIKELTSSIQEIANKNYSERVRFLNHNEYGD